MRVCVVAYKYYESSPRVMMFTNMLVRSGHSVEVLAIGRPGQPTTEEISGVRIHRLQERTRNEKGRLSYFVRILSFFIRATGEVTQKHLQTPYDLVHIFSVPEFLVFSAILPRLTGAAVLLDCFDLVPEFYASKFKEGPSSLVFKLLTQIEKLSVQFSNYVVSPVDIWKQRLISRSGAAGKCTVIMYHPDPEIFFRRPRVPNDGKFILIYPGTLNVHQGIDIAVRAFARISSQIPNAEFHIYGEGPAESELRGLVSDLALNGRVIIRGFLPAIEIADKISEANLGIVPKRASSQFGNEAPSTKIVEFMALGIPVIASRTAVEQSYLDESVVQFFDPDNERDLADSIMLLVSNPQRRQELASNAYERIISLGCESEQRLFLQIINAICSKSVQNGRERLRTVLDRAGGRKQAG